MGASVQPTDPLTAQMAKVSGGGDPLAAQMAKVADPMAKWHQAYQTGALTDRNAVADAKDQADLATPNKAQQVAETFISGIPGANRAVSGYRGLLSLAGLGSDTPGDAMAEQRRDVAAMPLKARLPLQLLGGIPAAAAAMPLGLVGGGAALGAASGADQPATSALGRLKNTAFGAGIGGVAAKGAQLAGSAVANLANRTGLTDKIAGLVGKVSPEAGAAMGTRGQVNSVLSDRQDILDQLGNMDAPGKLQLERIAATKAKAAALYGTARQDQQIVTDPRIQALLQDPDVANAFNTVKSLRAAQGNPVPSVNNLAAPPQAQMNKLIRPEDWQRMMQNPENQSAIGQLPTGLSGMTTESVPDPEALATMKRYLGDASRGLNSPLQMKQDAAIATLDKMQQLRSVLHDVSPAYKQADAFYADAKGQEDAFAHGFDAFRNANAPSGAQLPTHTSDAMLQIITTPRYLGEPPEALANRAAAFRQGARAAVTTEVKAAPVDAGLRSILKSPSLTGDQQTQGVRQLMFDPSQSPQATTFEQSLARQRGKMMQTQPARGVTDTDLAYHSGRMRAALRTLTQAPDNIGSPRGQQLLAERQGNPSLLSSEIQRQRAGETTLAYLARIGALTTGNLASVRPSTP